VSGEQIRAAGFQNVSDFAAQIPGLRVQENELFPGYFIRGAGVLTETTDLNEQPVGSYIDDVYLGSPSASRGQLFDVDRVEVLRGPQGTLFGRNTSAGVIHTISRRPGDTLNGYLQLGYGSYQRFEVEGAVGGPLSSGLRVRASGKYVNDEGWQTEKFTGQRFANSNNFSGRVQLEADLSESLTFWGKIDHSWASTNSQRYSFSGLYTDVVSRARCTPAQVNTHVCVDANGYADLDFDWKRPTTNVPPLNTLKSTGYTGRFDWRLGQATVTSITDYRTIKREWSVDGDASPRPYFGGGLDFRSDRTTDNKQFSQELRLSGVTGPVTYVVGGFYYYDKRVFRSAFPFAGQDTLTRLTTDSVAGFGQVDIAVAEGTTLIGGLRYTSEVRSIMQTNLLNNFQSSARNNDNKLTGKIGIQKNLGEHSMIYVTGSTGFKSGTYGQTLRATGVRGVNPETVRAFEAGLKTEFLNRNGRFNLAVYSNRYKDFQASGSEVNPLTGLTINRLNNVGTLNAYGVEGDLTLLPIPNLIINAGFAYTHTRVSSNQTSGEVDPLTGVSRFYDGKRAPQTPSVQLTGSVRYDMPVDGVGKIGVMISGSWQSMVFESADNDPHLVQTPYALANASILWESTDKKFNAQLYVDNLFNKRVVGSEYLISFIGLRATVWGNKPRWIGARVGYNF
jgi:iron complex outermembrane receptor protein